MSIWRHLDSLTHEIHYFGKPKKPKKLKAKPKKKKFPWFILLILLIPISFIDVPITHVEHYTVQVPYEQKATTSAPQATIETVCDTREFAWSYSWGEWQNLNGRISPTYILSNNEADSGVYTVQFAYFDGNLYPYENYQGKAYELVASKLPWRAAAMIAEQQTYTLRARQTMELAQFVVPQDPRGTYWVYAHVQAPTVTNCQEVRTYKAKNQTETKYRDEQRTRFVNESVPMWRWPIERLNS